MTGSTADVSLPHIVFAFLVLVVPLLGVLWRARKPVPVTTPALAVAVPPAPDIPRPMSIPPSLPEPEVYRGRTVTPAQLQALRYGLATFREGAHIDVMLVNRMVKLLGVDGTRTPSLFDRKYYARADVQTLLLYSGAPRATLSTQQQDEISGIVRDLLLDVAASEYDHESQCLIVPTVDSALAR